MLKTLLERYHRNAFSCIRTPVGLPMPLPSVDAAFLNIHRMLRGLKACLIPKTSAAETE